MQLFFIHTPKVFAAVCDNEQFPDVLSIQT